MNHEERTALMGTPKWTTRRTILSRSVWVTTVGIALCACGTPGDDNPTPAVSVESSQAILEEDAREPTVSNTAALATEPVAAPEIPMESTDSISPIVEVPTEMTIETREAPTGDNDGDIAREFIDQANDFLNQELNAQAVETAKKAVAAIPNPKEGIAHEAWQTLGVAQQIAGLSPEAEVSLRNAVALDPDCGMALHYLATAIAAQDRCTEAIPVYQEASKAEPGNPEVLDNLARCFDAIGNSSAADQVRAKVAESESATEATNP